MLVREMIKLGESRLTKAHCMDPWLDAELIYYHITGADRVELFLRGREPVDEETQKRYFDLRAGNSGFPCSTLPARRNLWV